MFSVASYVCSAPDINNTIAINNTNGLHSHQTVSTLGYIL